MECFEYKKGEMFVDGVRVAKLAEKFGTPLYVYNRSFLLSQYRQLTSAFSEINPQIYYAIKANSNAAVISAFAREGAGADVVSGGELWRAVRAGVDPSKIVFAGVGKTVEEIDYALTEGIHCFTVESEPELERISQRAQALNRTGRIAIRVNPDVDPKTHKYTSTGKKESKFGVNLERAVKAYELAASLPGLEIAGIHMHIGSPIMSVEPYAQALEKVAPVCRELKAKYPNFTQLDIGGGLGIQYRDEQEPFDVRGLAKVVIRHAKELGMSIGMEPGRFLVGNAGLLVCRVQYIKDNPFKKFIISDGGMNDLIRPALYEAYHKILPVREMGETVLGDLVGPVCESGDFLAAERDLPKVEQGDLIAVKSAGAYAFAMASSYNSRPRPAEVMVQGKKVKLIRAREKREDLVRGEKNPEW